MHARIITINTPKNHNAFIQELTNRKYPVEGSLRKGYAQAHIAEVRVWDIRAKKEMIPQMLTDMGALDLGSKDMLGGGRSDNVAHHIPTPLRVITNFVVNLARKLSGHFAPQIHTPELWAKHSHIPSVGWQYTFLMGCYKDPEREAGIEEI